MWAYLSGDHKPLEPLVVSVEVCVPPCLQSWLPQHDRNGCVNARLMLTMSAFIAESHLLDGIHTPLKRALAL